MINITFDFAEGMDTLEEQFKNAGASEKELSTLTQISGDNPNSPSAKISLNKDHYMKVMEIMGYDEGDYFTD